MAHNFRRTGGRGADTFIGKAGIPATANGTRDNPFATLAAYNGGPNDQIIGAGVYSDVGIIDYGTKKILGDGKVVFKGDGTGTFISMANDHLFEDIEIRDYEYLIYNQYENCHMLRCILRNGKGHFFNGNSNFGYTLIDCIAINAVCELSGQGQIAPGVAAVRNSLFLNGSVLDFQDAANINFPSNCYFDSSSKLIQQSGSYLPQRCNIRGPLQIAGVLYASLADAAVAYPALTTTLGNYSQDPRFNKPESEDFTLRLDSPHLNAGTGPSHLRFATSFYVEMIGGASVGDLVTAQNCQLRSTANPLVVVAVLETNGLLWNSQGGISIKANTNGVYEGYILFDKIRISDVPQKIIRWRIIAGLNFNTDYPGTEPTDNQQSANPDVYNNNVVDYSNYSSGAAGRNPNRLTEQFRWSNNPLPGVGPSDTSDWVTGGTFVEFEIDSAPEYNLSGYVGNGMPNFDPVQALPVVARWIQPRVKLRNNYYSK
jgi:hypothetical protein